MASPYTFTQSIVKIYTSIFDRVFPAECLHCHKEGNWLCSECESTVIRIKSPTCPFCDRLSPLGKTCSRCSKNFRLSGARSLYYYKSPVDSVIHSIKYTGVHAAITHLAQECATLIDELPLKMGDIALCAVPSTAAKIAKRGYNPSEKLAQEIGKQCGIPVLPLLLRTNNAQSQTSLTRKERLENPANQYKIKPNQVIPKTVILIDDVITTGATLHTCAELLKAAGVRSVWAITLAKD